MKEKPRLKDTGEILSSLNKHSSAGSSSIGQRFSRHRQETAIDTLLSATPPGGQDDSSPLDFGKYELPARSKSTQAVNDPAIQPSVFTGETQASIDPQNSASDPSSERVVQEYVFPTLEELEQREAKASEQQAVSQPAMKKKILQKKETVPPPRNSWMEDNSASAPLQEELSSFQPLWSTEEDSKSSKQEVDVAKDTRKADPQLPKNPPMSKAKKFLYQALGLEHSDEEAEKYIAAFTETNLTVEPDSTIESTKPTATEQIPAEPSFYDALTEKFMQERERYLHELGIALSEEDSSSSDRSTFVPPTRKRLDYSIRPEMHTNANTSTVKPVTYNRSAVTRPQTEVKPSLQSKKSGEQLLLELARGQQRKIQQAQQSKTKNMKNAQKKSTSSTFRFAPPASTSSRTRKGKSNLLEWKKKPFVPIVLLACTVALFSLGAFTLFSDLWLTRSSLYPNTLESAPASNQQTFYENRNFAERARFDDVIIPRNITVQNMTVDDRLVIQDIGSPGSVRLDNVTVSGVLYVKSCASEGLELHDVLANRIVVNNDQTKLKLSLSGSTDVGTLEVRTPVEIEQSEMAEDAPGIRNMVTKIQEDGTPVHAQLSALELHSLTTEGEAILEFDQSKIENMTSSGSLALSGNGKIRNLSVEQDSQSNPLSLQVQDDVQVSILNVKSPADIRLSSQVDAMSASDNLSLYGGSVGTLALNNEFGDTRLLLDITDTNVHSLTANTPTRIYSTGMTRVNTLTANDSVYVLGNKLNHLEAKSDNVIYENEPDQITVDSGVAPPQTTEENPDIDYQLTALSESNRNSATNSAVFEVGDGTAESPYEVSTPEQLAAVSSYLNAHFIQTSNINLADNPEFAENFPMIASAGKPFSGSYNGAGYAIANLHIVSDAENVGLFAENIGLIENVHITSGEIIATSQNRAFVGGVTGLNYEKGTVSASSNNAKVTGSKNSYTGGVAGYNYGGKIRNSYNAAAISGSEHVGGIVGMNRDNSHVSGSYNVGKIKGSRSVGSVVGTNEASVITNVYYLADTASAGIGTGEGSATECSIEEMRSDQMVADLSAGNENSPWQKGSGNTTGYPYPVLKMSK